MRHFFLKWSLLAPVAGRCAAAVRQLLPGGIWRKSYFYTNTCYFMQTIFLFDLEGNLKDMECTILHFRVRWNSLSTAS